ncbi:MAG: hypothetical protein ACI9QD_000383 [Thermoproteota archaeon]|jgi:hypothetical protein
MRNLFLLFTIFLLAQACSNSVPSSQKRNTSSIEDQSLKDELEIAVISGLDYLKHSQVKEEIPYKELKGEWPSYMTNKQGFLLLGNKGKAARDSNSFSTSTIHNLLAEMYIHNPNLSLIPFMLAPAIENILTYRKGESFNFWPWIPMKEIMIKKNESLKDMPLVRGPTHYELPGKFINNAANVANDSDDTAQAYRALFLNKAIAEMDDSDMDAPSWSNKKIGHVFSEYRDHKRHKAHFYNRVKKIGKNTGAFLTWLSHERKWLAMRDVLPKRDGNYIPYGVNDVDCVVNTNVLSALTMYGELYSTEGAAKACTFINEAIQKDQFNKCDVYYPNRYTLHYTAAHAMSLGAECLQESMDEIITDLYKHQENDGSWTEKWSKDKTQSTAYALNALLETGDSSPITHTMILKGIRYLLDHSETSGNGVSWKGGIFFSGGTIIRKAVVWISDPVTTAYVTAALEKYRLRQYGSEIPFYKSIEKSDKLLNHNPYLGYFYRQSKYQLFDLQGDIALAGSLKVFLGNGMDMLTGGDRSKDLKEKEKAKIAHTNKYKSNKLNIILPNKLDWTWTEEKINLLSVSSKAKAALKKYAIGTNFSIDGNGSNPFKVKNISKMFMQVMYEEYRDFDIIPKHGNIHKWHPTFKEKYKKKKAFILRPFSKLMHALFKGVSSKFLVTGKELELSKYIISRPYDSVTLDQCFRASYKLNNGDLYLTLLTIENIFSEHWDKPDRDNRIITRKLARIHHHFNKGDKYGAWYHLYGMMVYGYVKGRLPAKIVGKVEAIGAGLFSRFKADKQENFMNKKGGTIGSRLHKLVKKFNKNLTWPTKYFTPDPKYIDPIFYLNPNFDFSKKIVRRLKKIDKRAVRNDKKRKAEK